MDTEEDVQVVIKLTEEIESQYSQKKITTKENSYVEYPFLDTVTDEDEDLLSAIKITEAIESRFTQNIPKKQNSVTEYISEVSHIDKDLMLAIKLSEEIEIQKNQNTSSTEGYFSGQEIQHVKDTVFENEDKDLLLAIKLSEEIEFYSDPKCEPHGDSNSKSVKDFQLTNFIEKPALKENIFTKHAKGNSRITVELSENEEWPQFLQKKHTKLNCNPNTGFSSSKMTEMKLGKYTEYKTFSGTVDGIYTNVEEQQKPLQQDSDYEFALKLSQKLNSEIPIQTKTHFHPKNHDYDCPLGVQLPNENSDIEIINDEFDSCSTVSSGLMNNNGTTRHYDDEFSSKNYDTDYLLAMQIAFNSEIEDADSFEVQERLSDSVKLNRNTAVKRSTNNKSKKIANNNNYMDRSLSVVDPSWETIDPNPDIYALFLAFNKRFFWGKLDMVEVKWSPRMTSCAGICTYRSRAGHCIVSLSKPLLQYRPRKDLIETLLHEMIHAYLFVTKNDRDRDGHGPQFHEHMYRINRESGSHITVYHNFYEEVKFYKTHWWKCDGLCQRKPPYFGMVKRSMNRAPGPNDLWWNEHLATCGGTFYKIKEPENYMKNKKEKEKRTESISLGKNANIYTFFNRPSLSQGTIVNSTEKTSLTNIEDKLLHREGLTDTSRSGILASSNIIRENSDVIRQSLTSNFTKSVFTTSSNKIITLSDLSKKLNQKSPSKNSSKSPKKWIPLPGQRNIFQFMNKS